MPLKELFINILFTYSFTHTLMGEELKVVRKIVLTYLWVSPRT